MDKRTLYKKSSIGKIQVWSIWTINNVIHMEHGILNGRLVHSQDVIMKGKNIGTKLETTPEQQSKNEAISKYNKKVDKDYRRTLEEIQDAGDDKVSADGGYLPMLAKKYDDNKQHVKYPCIVQPKLDGIRCIARKDDNKVTLWFRSGKHVTTMDHIVKQLEHTMYNGEMWDGELYIHGGDFNSICGSIRRDKHINKEDAKKIIYYIYDAPRVVRRDIIDGMLVVDKIILLDELQSFSDRMLSISRCEFYKYDNLNMVCTTAVRSEYEIKKYYDIFVGDGYEGIMIRNINMLYEQKRSSNLLKYKEFNEDEFKIIGYEEGRGVLRGCVGAFILEMEDGKRFNAKLKGKGVTDLLREYYEDPDVFMDKMMTVKYQGVSADGIPRFPVGKVIRFDKL